jgi:glycosyltransferase involved in cell wall biosynthesis
MMRRYRTRADLRTVEEALGALWAAVLGPDTPASVSAVRTALRRLVELSDVVDLAAALATQGSARQLAAAWHANAVEYGWPPMTVAQAVKVATVVDRTLALLAIDLPVADVVHATANGPCGLLGMAAMWRGRGRLILTEHGVYLREQYRALRASGLDWVSRRALTVFTRRLCEVVLREAEGIYPVSDFNQTWERELGAPSDRLETIRNAVSSEQYAVLDGEPAEPVISFVGRIDPLKDLETLIRAHAIVVRSVPGTRLRLFGPIPDHNLAYAEHLHAVVVELGTGELVSWEGRVAGSRPAIEAGQLVALSSISEGMPYTLIETLMCGRASVSTDVGGVAECVSPDGSVGYVVPPRQPEAFAAACVDLLTDETRRRQMGSAAAEWARERFDLVGFTAAYAKVYEDVSGLDATPMAVPDLIPYWLPAPVGDRVG